MAALLRELWARVLRPDEAFARRAAQAPGLAQAAWRLMFLRAPVAALDHVLLYALLLRLREGLPACAPRLARLLREDPGLVKELLAGLPALPPLGAALPWLLLLAPASVLGLWMHHTAWDHGMLWLLKGCPLRGAWRPSFVAEAEALQAGVFGAFAALLGRLPLLGWVLAMPLGLVSLWFWVLRGRALAAWHRCPAWKGVAATLLHLGVLPLAALVLLACSAALALVAVRVLA